MATITPSARKPTRTDPTTTEIPPADSESICSWPKVAEGLRCLSPSASHPYSPKCAMALTGPPRNHEIGVVAKAIFTPVRGRRILGSSAQPGPMLQGFLCRVLGMRSQHTYDTTKIRN